MAEPTQHDPVISAPSPDNTNLVQASHPAVDNQQPPVVTDHHTQVDPRPDPIIPPVNPEIQKQEALVATNPSEANTPPTRELNAPKGTMETPIPNPASATTIPVQGAAFEVSKPIDVPEPQNTLTARFTEAEWASLLEFRGQLPDIFSQAFPDNANARTTPITLWTVRIDPLHPNTDARVSVVLMKFLRARNLSVRDARDMLVGTLRWRDHFKIDTLLQEEFPQDVFGNVGHVYGTDKGGRPVIYNVYGGNQDLKAVFGDVQRFIRWRVALMERTVALMDFNEVDQTIQIHDYEGVSITSRDANSKNAASEASNIFQNHYPEFLYKKFFVNVPTLLNWIFWAFKPFIAANTLAKMSVVGSGTYAISKALLPWIDANQLPRRYGGQADGF